MKIAQACHRYHPYIGGVETHVKELSERLVERGFDVDVLTTDSSGKLSRDEIIRGVRVKRFKSLAPGEAYHFSGDLRKYFMENSNTFDIVHAHAYHSFPSLYAAQAKRRNRLVFTPHYHGTGHTIFRSLLHRPYKLVGRKIFEKADKIICVSNYERNLLFKHFKVDEEKVVVIPNGINLKEFKNLRKNKKDCRNVLYVGRLEKYKGVHHLIKALPQLDPDIFLEIVGKGPYKETLIRLIKKLNVEDRVRFSHSLPRNELLQKYADADVFALLSEREAYGISVAEALASKTPCIVTNTSALKEWIDNENCFGINHPVNVEELVKVVGKVVGRKVRHVKLWDCEEVAEHVSELYNEIVNPALMV